ncbi:MAG: ribonuclease PH [Planctomycetota bacterium]
MTPRHDGRLDDQLRPFSLERGYISAAPGSVLVRAGQTVVLCTASVSDDVPPWMRGAGKGWVTAEYSMLPGSTSPRKQRERKKVDGRTTEIQRLIGRSLRAVVDLQALGERSVTVDCDVLHADGGTRTASITGAFVALVDALRSIPEDPAAEAQGADGSGPAGRVLRDSLAAVSVGVVPVGGSPRPVLDLDYAEDFAAAVDMNVVMTGGGRFIELQGTGEEATFTREELGQLVGLGEAGVAQLTALQKEALGPDWPLD